MEHLCQLLKPQTLNHLLLHAFAFGWTSFLSQESGEILHLFLNFYSPVFFVQKHRNLSVQDIETDQGTGSHIHASILGRKR